MSDTVTLTPGTTERLQPWTLFKPKQDGTGSALQLEARFTPMLTERGFTKKVDGGLFAIMARQTGVRPDGNASFDWPNKKQWTVNLGVVDLGQLLATWQTRWTPHPLSWIPEKNNGRLQLFHQTPDGGSKIIKLGLTERGSTFEVSRGKDDFIRINLGVPDEVVVTRYLTQALDLMLRLGAA